MTLEPAQLPAPVFVPVELAGAAISMKPEPLGPGVVEVVGSGGRRIRLAPPEKTRSDSL